MASQFIVASDNGVRWTVRVVRQGDRYGLDDGLTFNGQNKHSPCRSPFDALIEFYDRTVIGRPAWPATVQQRGQFVSRYYIDTLLAHPPASGLNLHGDISAWSLDAATLRFVLATIKAMS